MSLVTIFVQQAFEAQKNDLETAIACICNALCCRNINYAVKNELILILRDMQSEQRAKWRGN